MARDYKIFDGTDWVSPCDKEIRLLAANGTWEWIDPNGRDVSYFDGQNWKPMDCTCICDTGYVANPDTGICEAYSSPTFTGTPLVLTQGSQNVVYGEFGCYLYNTIGNVTAPAYTLPITASNVYPGPVYTIEDSVATPLPITFNIQNALWGLTGQPVGAGRLNKVGTWDGDFSAAHELKYTFCLNVTVEREYLIGVAGDNYVKLEIDIDTLGSFIPLVDLYIGGSPGHNFKRWHVFPLTLPVGNHEIRLSGK